MTVKYFRITGVFTQEEGKKIIADKLKGEKDTDYLRRKLHAVIKKGGIKKSK